MTDTYKAIAGLIPDSTDEVELYECPANTSVPAAVINVCNIDSEYHPYVVYLTGVTGVSGNLPLVAYGLNRVGGAPQQISVTLSAGQTIRVKSGAADMIAFALMGLEVS